MDLQVGDIVELKSGGPKMTVAAVKADRTFCVWFNRREDYHEEQTGEFLVETLKLLSVRATPPFRTAERSVEAEASTETAQPVHEMD